MNQDNLAAKSGGGQSQTNNAAAKTGSSNQTGDTTGNMFNSQAATASNDKSVLVVEDDRFIGEMYLRELAKSGYTPTLATDGNDGLAKALTNSFDVILLDLMLPEKQGDEILRQLRADGDKVPRSKILVLTNYEEDDATRASLENLADGYLIKANITPRRLLEIIANLLK
ncbi:MAG: response regulator [Candidatus Nomurabacteria bacterium]|jgi:DNA-binding response OmpR family regulator|nr:response regulator [Candidatus Nomurabacteria bacterium]